MMLKQFAVLSILAVSLFSMASHADDRDIYRLASQGLRDLRAGDTRGSEEAFRQIMQLTRNTDRAQVGVINDSHYLEAADCGYGYVGAGSRVEIISPAVVSVGYYNEAVHVRVISNTDTTVLRATSGCTGYALNSYVTR